MTELHLTDGSQPLVVLGYLKAHRIKQEQVAEILHINRTTVNRKLNGSGAFTIKEAKILNKTLGVPLELFFED